MDDLFGTHRVQVRGELTHNPTLIHHTELQLP